ncbi:hypothetical protein [Nocardia nepalensis]|uniref:hypothetical protein n=1 Tax=Nocardia nepalensis TaxID=3375448 RepID=UPI003B685D4A
MLDESGAVPGVVDAFEDGSVGVEALFAGSPPEAVIGVMPPLVVGCPDIGELVEAVVAVVPDVGLAGQARCCFADEAPGFVVLVTRAAVADQLIVSIFSAIRVAVGGWWRGLSWGVRYCGDRGVNILPCTGFRYLQCFGDVAQRVIGVFLRENSVVCDGGDATGP